MADSDSIATFCGVTGARPNTAEQLLEMFNGDVERAMNYYFENPGLDNQAMSEEDARAAAAAFQEDEPPAPAVQQQQQPLPIDLTGEEAARPAVRRPGFRNVAAAPSAPTVQEPDEVDLMEYEEEDEDADAQLRTLAAHRQAGLAAAAQAQRMVEGMMSSVMSAHGMGPLPSMFPGLTADGVGPPGLRPTGHPVVLEDDEEEDDLLPSRRSGPAPRRLSGRAGGLEVRGVPLTRGMGVGVGGGSRGGSSSQLESDEALARRLMQEEQEAMGLDGIGAGPRMEPGPAHLPGHAGRAGPSGAADGVPPEDEDMHHEQLGVDRHELEEARMIEAAMLGIPYEPRLPPRRSTPAVPMDPLMHEQRNLRAEQDQAFEESLAADRAKADAASRAAREAEEAAKQEREAAEAAAREAAEKEAILQALLARKAASLPQEPATGTAGAVTVMVRMPDGSRLSRRFSSQDPLQAVFDFIDVQHQAASLQPGSYRLVNSYPRKVFQPDTSGSLADAGITADTALFVEAA